MSASSTSCSVAPWGARSSGLSADYQIRAARPEDAEALYHFGETLLAETSFFLRGPGERARSVGEMRSVIERFDALPYYLLLNVWDNGSVVGEAIAMGGDFKRNQHTATVGIGILAAHAGQGLGRKLMRALDGFAVESGMRRLELTVMTDNPVARSLYLKMGYVEEGTKQDSMYIDGRFVSEIMMAKLFP